MIILLGPIQYRNTDCKKICFTIMTTAFNKLLEKSNADNFIERHSLKNEFFQSCVTAK